MFNNDISSLSQQPSDIATTNTLHLNQQSSPLRTVRKNSNYKRTNGLSQKHTMVDHDELEGSFETMDLDRLPTNQPTSNYTTATAKTTNTTNSVHVTSTPPPSSIDVENNNNNSSEHPALLLHPSLGNFLSDTTRNDTTQQMTQYTPSAGPSPRKNNTLKQQQQPTSSLSLSSTPSSYFPPPNHNAPVPSAAATAAAGGFSGRQAIRTLSIRNYERFPGNNIFFCHGRCLTNRVYWAFALAIFLLLAPSVLFAVFICPWLWYQIHPSVPIIFGYLFVLSLVSMIKTSWTDPGILPRHLHGTFSATQDAYGHAYELQSQSPPPVKQVTIKGELVHLKYCDTCGIYRPPRSSHCRQCNNCVENEDHHCIWLNNCVGKRNYRSFFTFIVTATLLCIYVHVLTSTDRSFKIILDNAPVSFLLVILCFFLLLPVGSLTGYHCFLNMRGVTTHEQLRSSIAMRPLESHLFDFGNPVINFIYALCRPRTKSYLARRKYVQERYDVDQGQMVESTDSNQPSSSTTTAVTNS
ncbi:DHHC palmitoyltransferase-domain-containing protein [Absidia repens]|uniref:Palmitoyltransferase n=1 Tax=Absidia repens TaxID=90262 RepID=A0A1X2IAU5_9FUNG|nr:DHHC palmitoyltransferase-domain-containing protein [Absidia repens]